MRPWSLAQRLTAAFVAVAFALLAGAMFVQYRTLERSLSAEDDEMLLESLVGDLPATERPSAQPSISGEAGPYGRVLDAQCRVVRTEYIGTAPPPPPGCDVAPGTRPVFRSWRASDGHVWRIATVRTSDGWMEEILDRRLDIGVVAEYRRVLSVVLVLTLALLGLVGIAIARRSLAPLNALAARMARVTPHSLDQRLGVTGAPGEIRPLAESFDRMLDRLQAAFAALNQSTAELAHELRTPLHVLRQRAEVALQRARTPEEYREVLRSTLEDLEALGRMIDDMLFLARAEDPRASIERSDLNVAAELGAVAEFLDALAAEGHVTIAIDAPPTLVVNGDRTLLRRALVNIVTNSLRHTPTGGRIELTACQDDGRIAIAVADTGSGIAPEFLPHIFDRHIRAPSPNGTGTPGAGLGLAIVRGIVQLHGGSAEASSILGRGTRITLRFPLT